MLATKTSSLAALTSQQAASTDGLHLSSAWVPRESVTQPARRTTFPPVREERGRASTGTGMPGVGGVGMGVLGVSNSNGGLPPPPAGLPPPGAMARSTTAGLTGARLEDENANLKQQLDMLQQQVKVDLYSKKYRSVSGGQFKGAVVKASGDTDEDLRRKYDRKVKEVVGLRRDVEAASLVKDELESDMQDLRAQIAAMRRATVQRVVSEVQTDPEPEPLSPVRPRVAVAATQASASVASVGVECGVSTTESGTSPMPAPPPTQCCEIAVQAEELGSAETTDGSTQCESFESAERGAQCVADVADAATQAVDDSAGLRILELEQTVRELTATLAAARAEAAEDRKAAAAFGQTSTAAKMKLAAAIEARKDLEAKLKTRDEEMEALRAELADAKKSASVWSKRCREALLCETTKVLVSCPKVTLALGEKDLPVYGQVDLDDVSRVIRQTLLPKYTTVMTIDEKAGEDIHVTVESLCNALVSDIAETLKKKVPSVAVNARKLSKGQDSSAGRVPSKG